MNEKMEQIRRAVKAGKLTADGARKALEDEMERELSQKPEDIDMDVVNACEALLTELSGADEALHTEENRAAIRRQMRRMESGPRGLRMPKAAAAAAALAAVLAFGARRRCWGFRAAITPNGLKNCSKIEWSKLPTRFRRIRSSLRCPSIGER